MFPTKERKTTKIRCCTSRGCEKLVHRREIGQGVKPTVQIHMDKLEEYL